MRCTVLISLAALGALAALTVPLAKSNDTKGKWVNVTPANVDLVSDLDCHNFGTISVVADPARPSNLYSQFHCQGIWKSVDYGLTWSGPINTGPGAAGARGAGGISIARGPDGQPPILYSAGIRGSGMGFWKSVDGGVSWARIQVTASREHQRFYPPAVDPHDPNHLLMPGHESNLIVRSTDGGRTWIRVPMASGMMQRGGTGFVFFVNTGNTVTTAQTWLWSAQGTGGEIGTWRTADAGENWEQVDSIEHPHGQMQIYQPDASGLVFVAGIYSRLGAGVIRSIDYGKTWRHVGSNSSQAIVFGTPNRVYSMFAWACLNCKLDIGLQSAPATGVTGWRSMAAPREMEIGAAQAATVFDGTNHVIVTANWRAGLWRFLE